MLRRDASRDPGTDFRRLDGDRLVEHRLAPSEPVDTLIFSGVFALRYAFSNGDFGRVVADPANVTPEAGPFQTAHGNLRVHELSFYVGSGVHF